MEYDYLQELHYLRAQAASDQTLKEHECLHGKTFELCVHNRVVVQDGVRLLCLDRA